MVFTQRYGQEQQRAVSSDNRLASGAAGLIIINNASKGKVPCAEH
jgi:hypothetical protein